jgi:hypothetical protein
MNQLVVNTYPVTYNNVSVVDMIGPIVAIIQIRCLNIKDQCISMNDLINLIKYLPMLDSLVVSSLSMRERRYLSVDEKRNLRLISNTNKISKVKLHRMNNLAQGKFLLDLCPSMKYFEIDCTNGVGPKRFVRFILMRKIKDNPYLSSLCLEISSKNKNMVKNLKKMIDIKQLCQNYTIKQKDNRIYLQWT